ncbi:hypothetical protein BDV38DRAFT_284830 [Aspergillus pseudotamarii]|uniref:RNase III domain-containing protein n=1 Tax=Aspergillus pseudotamarii TaxID=132259 RepID=A0A5N6SP69_ASPPS|nr:uncharacterized protein BDV38DRAFT_284830 [Aspergillus pseudotamarii]KAE8135570.1 hypothetical protein BDV38DRAFT_284830 [Aspergillus pseudotamarii]
MASPDQVQEVESIIQHNFTNKSYLRQALTAAGVESENHEGNRQLAQVGASWVDTVLNIVFMRMGTSKEHKAKLRLEFTKKDHFVLAAKQSGISKCIQYSCRSGFESATVLRNTMNAIVAAVLLDTNAGSISATLFVLSRIFKRPGRQLLETCSEATIEAVSAVADAAALSAKSQCPSVGSGLPVESLPIDRSSQVMAGLEHPQMLISPVHSSLYAPAFPMFRCDDSLAMIQNTGDSAGNIPPIYDPGVSMNISTLDITNDPNMLAAFDISWIDPTFGGNIVSELPSLSNDPPSDPQYATFPVPSAIPYEAPSSRTTEPKRPGDTGRNDQKGRKRAKRTRYFHINHELQDFLANEKTKCESQSLPPPEATYFKPEIHKQLIKSEKGLCEAFVGLLITIASPHTIIALGRMVQKARHHDRLQSCRLRDTLLQHRLTLIEHLEQEAGIIQIMSWYHIIEIFRGCGGHNTSSSTGYVHCTSDTFRKPQRTLGNPRNKDESMVTQTMLAEIFPDLKPGTEIYQSQLKKFNRLRKVGKRLHMLTETFGQGILGLILDNELGGRLGTNVSDIMFWKPTEEEFHLFVRLLNKSQGELLRTFSNAAWTILEPLLCCSLLEMGIFPIEQMSPEEILRHPKGSPGLLACIQ